MIQVQNLHKSFGALAAVRGLSFCARDGAITGLLGANGAGKSTTLRMLCAVLRHDRGAVHCSGEIGALLDDAGLYARLTARENIAYYGRLRKVRQLDQRIEELLQVLGIGKAADRPAAGFSQGERMKTALARAIVHSPRNVVLDEATNGLDVMSVRALRGFLSTLRERGHCVLFSSHILEEVRALCDNVVIIARGECVAEGTPEELCRRAGATSFEEAFVTLTGAQEVASC